MQLYILLFQIVAILFLPATRSAFPGNFYEYSEISLHSDGKRDLKKAYFLCETSSSTALCHKTRQLCDTSTGKARCICPEGWRGSRCQERIDEPPLTPPTSMPTFSRVGGSCTESTDCTTDHSYCIGGQCQCQSGFTPRKEKCININECEDASDNDCHRFAKCTDTEGSYVCYCKDGFSDASPTFPGRQCYQTNECKLEIHDCDEVTQVCVDRPPPKKWECVDITPAPTPKPSHRPTPPPIIQTVSCNSAFLDGEIPISDNECLCLIPLTHSQEDDQFMIDNYSQICKEEGGFYKYLVARSVCVKQC